MVRTHEHRPSREGPHLRLLPHGRVLRPVGNAGNALTFDGTTWSTPTSIDPDGRGLSSVSCPSTTFCAAVDRSSRVLTFDGSSWTAPALLEDPFGRSLSAVSCATSTFCVATSITTGVFVFDGTRGR